MMTKRYVITRKNIVDMAWKAEGLDKLLEEKEQKIDLRDLRKAYDIALLPAASSKNDEVVWAYNIMKNLTDSYNYDSGKSKFNSIS